MSEHSPPQLLKPDPIALYGRSDEAGNGPVQLVQNAPATGDTIVRNGEGYWVNQAPGGGDTWALSNLKQPGNNSRPARVSWEGLPAFSALKDETAALIKKEAIMVPVKVSVGDVIGNVGVLIGGTSAETPTHQWGALYEGALTSSEAILLSQSADAETAAITKEVGLYSWKLAKAQTITEAIAPHGYIYAAVQVTATVEPSVLGQTITSAANYAWATGAPAAFGQKFSVSGTEGVAKSPSGTLTKVTALPYVVLF